MTLGPVLLEAKNEKGRVLLYRPKPDVIVAVSEGFISKELWAPQVPVYDSILAKVASVSIYRDAWNVRTIEPGYRDLSQEYIKRHKAKFAEIIFLQRSAFLTLAINAVALFTRAPISAVGKDVFDRKLEAALASKAA